MLAEIACTSVFCAWRNFIILFSQTSRTQKHRAPSLCAAPFLLQCELLLWEVDIAHGPRAMAEQFFGACLRSVRIHFKVNQGRAKLPTAPGFSIVVSGTRQNFDQRARARASCDMPPHTRQRHIVETRRKVGRGEYLSYSSVAGEWKVICVHARLVVSAPHAAWALWRLGVCNCEQFRCTMKADCKGNGCVFQRCVWFLSPQES